MKSYEISVEIRADKIIALRKLRKQSQAALAREIGISPTHLCKIERGKTKNVSNTVAMKISQVLSVEPTEICIGYVEPDKDTENLLTEEEREQYTEMYFPRLRVAVRHKLQRYTFDFEEAYSEGLLVFAHALFAFNKARGCSFPTYLNHALDNAFKQECWKRTRPKRNGYTFSLDELIDSLEKDSRDLYNQYPSSFNLEDYVCSRVEG